MYLIHKITNQQSPSPPPSPPTPPVSSTLVYPYPHLSFVCAASGAHTLHLL